MRAIVEGVLMDVGTRVSEDGTRWLQGDLLVRGTRDEGSRNEVYPVWARNPADDFAFEGSVGAHVVDVKQKTRPDGSSYLSLQYLGYLGPVGDRAAREPTSIASKRASS